VQVYRQLSGLGTSYKVGLLVGWGDGQFASATTRRGCDAGMCFWGGVVGGSTGLDPGFLGSGKEFENRRQKQSIERMCGGDVMCGLTSMFCLGIGEEKGRGQEKKTTL